MNILTGHKGFIGSRLLPLLGDNVKTYGMEDCFNLVYGFDNWKDVECVYHIGGISDASERNVNKLYQYNIRFSIELFEKCIEHGVPVKWVSSASVFGNTFTSMTGRCINPLNQYAFSKAVVEQWVSDNLHRFNSFEGYRLYNVYGDGENHKGGQASPVTQFRNQAINDGLIRIFERSDLCLRDFICVEDVIAVMTGKERFKGIRDLGTSRTISFEKVALLIQKKYGGEVINIPFPNHLENKYQFNTRAEQDFAHNFKTLEEWLSL
jgi:ADP-L-glycero-D-manno-heptose 6-epimerase